MSRPIPPRPSLERDRKAAKGLRKSHAAADPEALARIRAHHPRFRGRSDAHVAAAPFRLADALLVVAREYGVESWPRWKALAAFLCADFERRVHLFLEAAYSQDPRRSEALVAHAPELTAADLHAACAACDAERVEETLARDPGAANRRGGPCAAEPLWTLCFSNVRVGDAAAAEARVRIARQLLARSADPNTSARIDAGTDSFDASALYATVARDQPALTRLLLEAGADPNDGESLYHASECRDAECLRALLAHGARPEGTNALLHALDYSDSERVRLLLEAGADPNEVGGRGENALHHAARRGRGAAEIDLLLRHGARLDAVTSAGRSAYAIARRLGNSQTGQHLLARGASDAIPDGDRFAAACAAGDAPAARALLARDPGLVQRLSEEDADVLVEAARRGRRDAVTLMLDVGFPVDAIGGYDMRATSLHHAVLHAHVEVVELLLARGADPEALNPFGGTALGTAAWASRHARPPVDTGPRPEAERQRDLLAVAERLLSAGVRILPDHLANASPPLAELLRRYGAVEAEE